jgi:hypothetical protein
MVLANASMTRPMVNTEKKKRSIVKPGEVGVRPVRRWVHWCRSPTAKACRILLKQA